jgi:hypothetical protein
MIAYALLYIEAGTAVVTLSLRVSLKQKLSMYVSSSHRQIEWLCTAAALHNHIYRPWLPCRLTPAFAVPAAVSVDVAGDGPALVLALHAAANFNCHAVLLGA